MKGEKCLEVKKAGNNYYVYRSTTYWDKKEKEEEEEIRIRGQAYTGRIDSKKEKK